MKNICTEAIFAGFINIFYYISDDIWAKANPKGKQEK